MSSTSNESLSMTQINESQNLNFGKDAHGVTSEVNEAQAMQCVSEEESVELQNEINNPVQELELSSDKNQTVIGGNNSQQETCENKNDLIKERNIPKLQLLIKESKEAAEILVTKKQKLIDELNLKQNEFDERCNKMKDNFKKRTHELEARMAKWTTDIENKHESKMNGLFQSLEEKKKKFQDEKVKVDAQLGEEKLRTRQQFNEMNIKMNREYAEKMKAEIQQKENITLQLSSEINNLQKEKIQIAEQFQGILLKKEEESLSMLYKLQKELVKVKTDLCETKAKSQILELELAEQNKDKELSLQANLQISRDILYNFGKIMDTYFQCSVCSEIFVTPIALSCKHIFCKFCLSEWKKTNNYCPKCKEEIKSENRFIVLDNIIDQLFEKLPEDLKKQRLKLVQKRKKNLGCNIPEGRISPVFGSPRRTTGRILRTRNLIRSGNASCSSSNGERAPQNNPGSNQPNPGPNQPNPGPNQQPGSGPNQPGSGPNQPGSGPNQPGPGLNQPGPGPNQPDPSPNQPGTV